MIPKWKQGLYDPPRLRVIFAQLLVLVALSLGLQFALETTGGTVFLFSTIAPLLVFVSLLVVIWHGIAAFRRRHSLFEYQSFLPGQVVFSEGDHGDCAYYIQTGAVEILRGQPVENRQIARLGPGDYFGEVSLLTDQPRNATVRALAETRVAVLGKENFLNLFFNVASARDDILGTVQRRSVR